MKRKFITAVSGMLLYLIFSLPVSAAPVDNTDNIPQSSDSVLQTESTTLLADEATVPAQSVAPGWHMTEGPDGLPVWQYYDENENTYVISSFRTINEKDYYFDENGYLKTDGLFEITGTEAWNGIYYATKAESADESPENGLIGVLAKDQWIFIENADTGNLWKYFGPDMKDSSKCGLQKIGGHDYFLDDNGKILTGFHPVDNGKNLYFGSDGIRLDYTGWHTIDGQIYFFNDQYQTDKTNHSGWLMVDDTWYWLENGSVKTGWLRTGNTWYYLNPQNGAMHTGLYQAGNAWYYSNTSGAMLASCWVKHDENWYYLNAGGDAATGWKKLGQTWYYLDPATSIMKSGWADINGRRYYLGGSHDGSMKSGWQKIENEWYYFGGAGDGSMKYGWQWINNHWYYMDTSDGTMEYGRQEINGQSYYLGGSDDGSMKSGWQWLDGCWYYYGPSYDGSMKYGWQKIGYYWYYLDTTNGSMKSGWLDLNGRWYYLGGPNDGSMKSGWLWTGSNWYYLGGPNDGSMKTGWQMVDSCWYYLYTENDPHGGPYGAMAASTVIDGWEIGADGRWITGASTLHTIHNTDYVQFWNMKNSISMGQLTELNSAISAFHARGYQVSFVLLDINTGRAVSYKSGLGLYSASAIKGPYVLSVLDAGHAPTNSIWNTINWSSNNDYSAIRRTYGAPVFQNWLAKAGVDTAQGARNYTATTSLDLAKMWMQGWDYLSSSRANADWARSTFQKVLNSPISARLSGAYTVYSKAGWYPGSGYYCVYNDAGIVRKGNSPYILAVMSSCPGVSGSSLMQNLIGRLDMVHSEMIR